MTNKDKLELASVFLSLDLEASELDMRLRASGVTEDLTRRCGELVANIRRAGDRYSRITPDDCDLSSTEEK